MTYGEALEHAIMVLRSVHTPRSSDAADELEALAEYVYEARLDDGEEDE